MSSNGAGGVLLEAKDVRKLFPVRAGLLRRTVGQVIVTSAIIGPRMMEQLEDNLGCLGWQLTPEDEAEVDRINPPGEHTGIGFNDPNYPVRGRPTSCRP